MFSGFGNVRCCSRRFTQSLFRGDVRRREFAIHTALGGAPKDIMNLVHESYRMCAAVFNFTSLSMHYLAPSNNISAFNMRVYLWTDSLEDQQGRDMGRIT